MKASDFLAKTVYRQLPPMPKQLRIRLRNLPLLLPPQQFLYRPLRSLSWLFSRPLLKNGKTKNSLVWTTRRIKIVRLARCPVSTHKQLLKDKDYPDPKPKVMTMNADTQPKTKQRGKNPTTQLFGQVSQGLQGLHAPRRTRPPPCPRPRSDGRKHALNT